MLYDNTLPRVTDYGNSFDAAKYASDVRRFNKHKNTVNAARPWWQAALQFIPFGLGNVISPAIEAGISKGTTTYQGRLDRMAGIADDPSFDYGFDSYGKFFSRNRVVPTIDNPGARDAAIWAGVGGGVKTASGAFAESMGRDVLPQEGVAPFFQNQGVSEESMWANPAPANSGQPSGAPSMYDNYPALNTPQVVANPSAGNMDWTSQWNNPTSSYKHGGVLVTGGDQGEDDIALVDADSGQDTGKRVSSGEMIVFSEKTLAELSKALKDKDKDSVFSLVQDQIKKKPNRKGGMINGAAINITPSAGNMDWGWPADTTQPYEEAPNPEYFDVQGNRVVPAPVVADAPKNTLGENLAYWIPSGAGNAMDSFRFAYGMAGADTPIPQWSKPNNWRSYVNELKMGAMAGFTPAERAAFQTQQDRQYLTDIANINNASNSSSAIALGNYGRANTQQYLSNLNFAAADAAQRRANVQMYGSALANDVNLDRLIFGDKYQEAKQKEAAGAKLANDAFMNIKDRAVVDQFYNPQSLHGKTQSMELASKEETLNAQKAFMKFLRENPELFKTAVGSSAGAMDADAGKTKGAGTLYDEYVAGGGTKTFEDFKKTIK